MPGMSLALGIRMQFRMIFLSFVFAFGLAAPAKAAILCSQVHQDVRATSHQGFYSKKFQSLSHREQQIWLEFSREFQTMTKRQLQLAHKTYLHHLKEKHPQILFLMKLGFRFEGEIHVPTIFEIANRLHDMQSEQVRKNEKLESDRISFKTMLLFKTQDGKIDNVTVDLLGSIPPDVVSRLVRIETPAWEIGYELGKLSNEAYVQNVRDGQFFLGPLTTLGSSGGLNLLMHDLGHMGAYIESPLFWHLYRKALIQKPTKDLDENLLFYVSENSLVIKDPWRGKMIEILKLEDLTAYGQQPSLNSIRRYFDFVKPAQLQKIMRVLKEDLPKMILRLGGTTRDIMTIEDDINQHPQLYRYFILQRRMQGIDVTKTEFNGNEKNEAAELAFFSLALSRLTPGAWVDGAIMSPRDMTTPLYQFRQETGAF